MEDNNSIVLSVKLDTSDSVSKIMKLKNELNDVDKKSSLEERFESLNKLVEKNALSYNELKKAINEYVNIAAEAGESSPIGVAAIEKAGKLKDRISDLKSSISALGRDGKILNSSLSLSKTVLNGYSAFAGITKTINGDNQELLKTMVRLQVAVNSLAAVEEFLSAIRKGSYLHTMALVGAKRALTFITEGASLAMKGFRAALISTGIGAIVVLIGYLISKFDDLVKMVKKLTGAYNENAEAMEKLASSSLNRVRDMSDAMDREYNRRLKIVRAKGEETYNVEKEFLLKKLELKKKEIEFLRIQTEAEVINGKLSVEQMRERKKEVIKLKEELKDIITDLQVLEINRKREQEREIEKERERLKELRNSYRNEVKETNKAIKDEIKNLDKITFFDFFEKSKKDTVGYILDNYYALKKELDILRKKDLISEEEYIKRLNELNKNLFESREEIIRMTYKNRIEITENNRETWKSIEKDYKDSYYTILNYSVNSFSTFSNIFNQMAELSQKNAKKAKTYAMMSIITSQAQSIAQAVLAASKTAAEMHDPTGFVRIAVWASTFLSITSSILSGISQAKKLMSQIGETSSAEISNSVVSNNNQSSSYSMYSNDNIENGRNRNNNNENNNNNILVKAIIVENDITKSINNSNKIENYSSF